jgi:hypothetical protein
MVCCFLLIPTSSCFSSAVTLQWDPEVETDIAGYKLYYQADSAKVPFKGTGAAEGSSPININSAKVSTATVSGLDPNKKYYFAVTAFNPAGTESKYSNVVSISEKVAPTITISSPLNNSAVNGTVSVKASASDNVGVVIVEYYVNGFVKAKQTSGPYQWLWDTSALATGSYTLSVKAYDSAGNIGLSNSVNVILTRDTVAPVISLDVPVSGSKLSGKVAVTANASDNVGVTKVEIYINASLYSVGNVLPLTYNWDTTSVADGSYILFAEAYDAAGNLGVSKIIYATVNNKVK